MMKHNPRLHRYTNIALFTAATALVAGSGAAVGCNERVQATTAGGGQGGAGGSTTTGKGGDGGGVGGGLTVGSGGQSTACDQGLVTVDDDMDGFTEMDGDCNDCDPNANPGAAEVIAEVNPEKPDDPLPKPADEDCDKLTDEADPDLKSCDSGLALASEDPLDAVKAIGFCDTDTAGKVKFIKKVSWVLADGLAPGGNTDMVKFHMGHGMLKNLGPNAKPKEGEHMLALSSGTARNKTDAGFVARNYDKGYSSNAPLTFNGESPACPGVVVPKTSVQDAAGLELEMTTPTNALSLEFSFIFYSYEMPQFVCSQYNDFFWANLVQGSTNKNISFDSKGNAISVNAAFMTQCECPPEGPGDCVAPPFPMAGQPTKTFNCAGKDLLTGTDFDGNTNAKPTYNGWANGATGWLTTTAPVEPNQTLKLRFVTFDSGVDSSGKKDHNVDSTVLIDKFRWHAIPAEYETKLQ